MAQVKVRKLDHLGRLVVEYPGDVLHRDAIAGTVELRTAWDRARLDLGYVILEPGDQWTERFFADRWYNIFEIRAGNGRLKGWYCNVTRPAHISETTVAWEDLALDLWVAADGTTLVLDEDEFAHLSLEPDERAAAKAALDELLAMVCRGNHPFDGGDRRESPAGRVGA